MAEPSKKYQQVEQALDEIRPYLSEDLGGVELVDVTEDGDVYIRWLGNCEHCEMSDMTLKAGVERAIRSKIPDIKSVIPVH